MPKLGIVIPDDMQTWLERPLGYGDSRSERIRECLSNWRAVEETLVKDGFDPDELEDSDVRDMAECWVEHRMQPAD
jgi:hypothetical protein